MIEDLIILALLILLSGFFAASEIAFVVANKIKVEIKARKKNMAAKNALHFINDPQDFFSVVLIGNNIVNVAFASVSTVFLSAFFGFGEIKILLLSTFVLLIFGELLPKYFARELADRVVFVSAIPIRIVSFILYPFVKFFSSISSLLTQSSDLKPENIRNLFSKEDIESLVKESHEAGVVNKKESDIISKVFDLADQRVYEAMRPRTEIVGIEINQTIDEALDLFIESGFSKLIVYDENLDNIKGMILTYDLFKSPENLQSIIREVIFVPETKKSFDMLNEFLRKQSSIAIVIDEFGGTAGIVTIEDIIEELFGEIKDEYDVEEDICRRIATDTYLISGKVEIDFINEKYDLNILPGDYETIAGFVTTKIGRIPEQGEIVVLDNFTILIARASNIRIDLVKLTLNTE
ncbi:MAG TPA: hemolysin family protein [Ignavibacteriaceae bacterium]|nr:hemolysin family protein [Ignavibacteriaceae bacterium]